MFPGTCTDQHSKDTCSCKQFYVSSPNTNASSQAPPRVGQIELSDLATCLAGPLPIETRLIASSLTREVRLVQGQLLHSIAFNHHFTSIAKYACHSVHLHKQISHTQHTTLHNQAQRSRQLRSAILEPFDGTGWLQHCFLSRPQTAWQETRTP